MGRLKPGKVNLKKIRDSNDKLIIPFGDYSGEYLEDLPDNYLSYLVKQSWFEEKFPKLFEAAQKLLDEQEDKELRDVY